MVLEFYLGTGVDEKRFPNGRTYPHPMKIWRADLGALVVLFKPTIPLHLSMIIIKINLVATALNLAALIAACRTSSCIARVALS